jgi:hypothetical protein
LCVTQGRGRAKLGVAEPVRERSLPSVCVQTPLPVRCTGVSIRRGIQGGQGVCV